MEQADLQDLPAIMRISTRNILRESIHLEEKFWSALRQEELRHRVFVNYLTAGRSRLILCEPCCHSSFLFLTSTGSSHIHFILKSAVVSPLLVYSTCLVAA